MTSKDMLVHTSIDCFVSPVKACCGCTQIVIEIIISSVIYVEIRSKGIQ